MDWRKGHEGGKERARGGRRKGKGDRNLALELDCNSPSGALTAENILQVQNSIISQRPCHF